MYIVWLYNGQWTSHKGHSFEIFISWIFNIVKILSVDELLIVNVEHE